LIDHCGLLKRAYDRTKVKGQTTHNDKNLQRVTCLTVGLLECMSGIAEGEVEVMCLNILVHLVGVEVVIILCMLDKMIWPT
jgi:hypothetical protein